MNMLSRRFREFTEDESGAFAVVFGVIAIVLIALGGAAVDFTMLQTHRSSMQTIMDSAALGMQTDIFKKTEDQLKAQAQALVDGQMSHAGLKLAINEVRTDLTTGTIRIEGELDYTTFFVTLVGVPNLKAKMLSEATRKSTRIEIAMVLDNSGSMDQSKRMDRLKTAARNAIDIFYAESNPANPEVFVGVVPFTQFVNVGTSNANAAWIDRAGISPITNDNMQLDDKAPVSSFNRIALHEQMRGEGWRGCVEARPYPYDTNDAQPMSADPKSLFTPLFVPDEPDPANYFDYDFNNSYLDDEGGTCKKLTGQDKRDDRLRQERMCKYADARPTKTSIVSAQGPNADCPYNAVTPLTPYKDTVEKAIEAMAPQGGTNIAQGAVWGFHMLTPGEPLDQAQPDLEGKKVNKVMILMTDGDHYHHAWSNMNGSRVYTAYGYPYNRRLGQPGDDTEELQDLMDTRLSETCENAKAAEISIFTIGLSLTRTKTREMLADCSNGEGYYFLPKTASELDDIFRRIASQLGDLRISR